MNEFELIARYFAYPAPSARVGVGDDCAVFDSRLGHEWAVSTDMLVEGRHFVAGADPESLGHKTLAVNLSDLAACGAKPRFALLALALPEVEEAWLAGFSRGFLGLAAAHDVDLIGGDTTRGPRNCCVTVLGEVPAGEALLRRGAKVGDEVWVSGCLGDAALGLAALQGRIELAAPARDQVLERLHRPTPRVALGLALRSVAHAAIDISDGFLADLRHLLVASGLSAEVLWEALPRSLAQRSCANEILARDCVLAGGDDYELCFTAPPSMHGDIAALSQRLGLPLSRVGLLRAGSAGEVAVLDREGRTIEVERFGFDHFAGK